LTSLLHLDSSAILGAESVSRQLTVLFADTWRAAHPDADYRYRDLAAHPIPPLTSAFCALGRRVERLGPVPLADVGSHARNPDERWEWAATEPLITELLAADTLLIGAPMYNLSITAALKAWIDRVTFPGAFAHGELSATRVVIAASRGGTYGPADHQVGYLRAYFGRHGVTDIQVVTAELTVAGLIPHLAGLRDRAAASLAAARTEMIDLATQAELGRRVVQP
jgi:FMN-dependent NADH-azoreductase